MEKSIRNTTLLLTFIAGYCNTVTYVAANRIFSSFVTGNIVLFAYDLTTKANKNSWINLITLPVFILAVMSGVWLVNQNKNKNKLLLTEGFLLLLSGLTALLLHIYSLNNNLMLYFLTMMIVFAMGLQNACGKIFSKETYGPTTMMTGNTDQAALDLGRLFLTDFSDASVQSDFKKQILILSGFFSGCIFGTVAGKQAGLSAAIFPGILLLLFVWNDAGSNYNLNNNSSNI